MQRFWEIDVARGAAVVMMIAFHLFFDLNYFGIIANSFGSGFWWGFARFIASTFIFLAGISVTISYARKGNSFLRGAKIFGFGLLITLMTWLLLKNGTIYFGILHFIGISVMLSPLFMKFKKINVLIGLAIIGIGIYLSGFVFNFPWLLWLGLAPSGIYMLDYFPIFPWFGLFLIGMYFGKRFYPKGKRAFKIFDASKNLLVKPFTFLGRNSLIIYLLHQPILIGILYLFMLHII